MSDLLKDIEDYLIAGNLAVADGTDLFRDKVPDSPDTAIIISEYGGILPTLGVAAYDRSVQIIVRDKTYAGAKRTSWGLFNYLVAANEPIVNITPTRWGIIHGRAMPFKFQEDKQARIWFVFNLGITTIGD